MERYVVFLRGINVSGQKLIKMEDLNRSFTALGFKKVKTLIQSGNVLFETPALPEDKLLGKIGRQLEKDFGYPITLVLKNMKEIEAWVKQDPFKTVKPGADLKKYAAFLAEDPKFKPALPLKSPKKEMEILSVSQRTVFCLAYPTGDGRYGFPNAWIESEFGVPATSRNWNTVIKLLDTADPD